VAFSLLLAVSLAAAVGPAAGADARLALTDTTVTPATPTAGAPMTVETTLRLSGGSDTLMTVEEVRVVNDSDGEVLGTATGLGRLSPGETLDVPVTVTVDDPGTAELRLVALGSDGEGQSVEASRPLTVGVERGAPQVEFESDGLVAGAETPVEATVSNPTTAPLRGIEVRVAGGESRATIPNLAAGASQTVNLTAAPAESGASTLSLSTVYTTPNGVRQRASTNESVTVEPHRADVDLRTARPQSDDSQQQAGDITGLLGGGGGSALQSGSDGDDQATAARVDVTVTNFGNAAVDDVVLTAEDGDGARLGSVGRFAVADTLAPGEETTVTVDLSGAGAVDDVRFVAAYETPEGRNETALVYGYGGSRGEASVTGVDVTLTDGGRVTIDGNLGNTGNGPVESAVVAVQPTDGVQPAYPQRDYFVGTVEQSAFAPFELTAQANTDNATEVTLQVRYSVDGEELTDTVTVPLPPPESGGEGGPLSLGATVAVVLGLAGVAAGSVYAVRYRNR